MADHEKLLENALEDARLFIGPILAVIASLLPWIYFGPFKKMNAFDFNIGIVYFLLALAAIGAIFLSKPRMKGKGLLIIGISMTICSAICLLNFCYAIGQLEGEFEGAFEELTGMHIGMGVIVAIVASLITVYEGYKVSSPDLTTPVPKTKKRKGLIVLNGIVGSFWFLVFLFAIIAGSEEIGSFEASILSISSPMLFITYFYTIYAMVRFKQRANVIYAAFVGIVGMLITLSAWISSVTPNFGDFFIFALLPLLVYVLNLYYAWETVSPNTE
ncbi:MAG: hypothetical protein KAT65_18980 [Methanophagales archaeon]|nr:hypothetical protein [Methanophagales archaeon]